ncbi:hypothetical protein ACJX0J_017533, partial [Zea mays]
HLMGSMINASITRETWKKEKFHFYVIIIIITIKAMESSIRLMEKKGQKKRADDWNRQINEFLNYIRSMCRLHLLDSLFFVYNCNNILVIYTFQELCTKQ